MKKINLILLVLLINSSVYADECFDKNSKPRNENEAKQAIVCLNNILKDFEKVNHELRGKVQKLEETVFGNDPKMIPKSTSSGVLLNSSKTESSLTDQSGNKENQQKNNSLKLSALIGSSTSVKLRAFRRDGSQIFADIEYENIGTKPIDLSSSISNEEIFLIDENHGKWLSEGGTDLGVISPGKKILTKMKFLPQGLLDGNIFTFKGNYKLDSKSWQVTINNIK